MRFAVYLYCQTNRHIHCRVMKFLAAMLSCLGSGEQSEKRKHKAPRVGSSPTSTAKE